MAKKSAELYGLNFALEGIYVATKAAKKAVADAQRIEANRIMSKSLRLVPRKTGYLADSHYIDEYTARGMVWFDLGYEAEYALAVHEIPPPPMESEGGRSATHGTGKQWKYLEQPYTEALPGYESRVAKQAAKSLSRSAKKARRK